MSKIKKAVTNFEILFPGSEEKYFEDSIATTILHEIFNNIWVGKITSKGTPTIISEDDFRNEIHHVNNNMFKNIAENIQKKKLKNNEILKSNISIDIYFAESDEELFKNSSITELLDNIFSKKIICGNISKYEPVTINNLEEELKKFDKSSNFFDEALKENKGFDIFSLSKK